MRVLCVREPGCKVPIRNLINMRVERAICREKVRQKEPKYLGDEMLYGFACKFI